MDIRLKDEDIMGYSLIIAGVCLVIYGFMLIFSISQGFGVPIDIFDEEVQAINTNSSLDTNQQNMTTPSSYYTMMIKPLFPMFNFLTWILIVFFIVAAGIRILRMGIKMLTTSIELHEITKHELEDVTNSIHLLKNKYL